MDHSQSNTSSHTPGPWTAERISPEYYEVSTPKTTVVVKLDRSRDGHAQYRERCEADARLIAAAPELLEALQLIVETYGFDPSVDSAIWQTAFKALAKAGAK